MSIWKNRTAVWCECGTCAITVDRTRWEPCEGEIEVETYIDFWSTGSMPTFLDRFRLAMRLLFRGASPHGVALDEDERLKLISALNAEPVDEE